ncbi:unnamed protein product [Symbiodinium sp. KB8]|nr:unnamed protein product [Symbiodinium sp. KB8]
MLAGASTTAGALLPKPRRQNRCSASEAPTAEPDLQDVALAFAQGALGSHGAWGGQCFYKAKPIMNYPSIELILPIPRSLYVEDDGSPSTETPSSASVRGGGQFSCVDESIQDSFTGVEGERSFGGQNDGIDGVIVWEEVQDEGSHGTHNYAAGVIFLAVELIPVPMKLHFAVNMTVCVPRKAAVGAILGQTDAPWLPTGRSYAARCVVQDGREDFSASIRTFIEQAVHKDVMVDINDRTTYLDLRSKLLQYERSYGGKGKGDVKGKRVVCYNCGKTGHIASECWSAPADNKGKGKKGKIRNVREDEDPESWNESSQHEHQQRGSQDSGNVRRAGDVRGNERVRRIETGRMPIIEEVEDEEDFIDLGALFAGFSSDATVRMVKMIPVCDMSMGDDGDYEKDELHWWYESTRGVQGKEKAVRKLTVKKEIEEDLEGMKYEEGWMFLRSGRPVRIDWDAESTYNPRKDEVKAFPYRTTLLTTYRDDEVNWSDLEFFECGEEWTGRERIKITASKEWNVVVTIMERYPCGMEEYGKYVNTFSASSELQKESEREKSLTKPSEEEKDRDEVMKDLDAMDSGKVTPADDERKAYDEKEEKRKELEKGLPSIGESMEEKMNVGGIELTPESTLKEMRKACEILGVGKTGSKAQVWKRMKEAVATSKLKELVEISKKIDEEFSRRPEGEKRPEPPSEEERKLHELARLPKADWCESCTATRSREDNFEVSEKKHEASLVSMDFKFTGTRDEENAKEPKDTLAISLVMVDQETKFVHVIPVSTKEATAYLVEEVCRVLMLLNSKVILRTDTEPAMISLRKKVQGIRKLKKLETEIQDVAPDAHEGKDNFRMHVDRMRQDQILRQAQRIEVKEMMLKMMLKTLVRAKEEEYGTEVIEVRLLKK